MTEKDERWGSYPETVLIFSGDPELFIDLREPVPPATRNALSALGLGEPFSILTAFNPRGVDHPPHENERRMEELEAELASSGDSFVRVDACSPDKSHCECSVALKGDMKRALDIARRWEQIAIFWWDGTKFWIRGAITDGELELPITGTTPGHG
jgi:hypothetical protein